jgi:Co/Zn/Cd efflux system component
VRSGKVLPELSASDGKLPLQPLAAASLLFFCLEFTLAIEVRSVSLFSDSIAFLEATSVSILMSSGRNWSMPGREAFARFSRTIILIPTSFLFWMIAANYYGAAIPSATPLAATGAAFLLTNIACLVMPKHGMFAHLAGSLLDIRNHAMMNTAVVLAAFLTWASGTMWPDVLVGLGILCANARAAEHIWLAARESPPIDA